jgi:hypothetical protein
VAAYTVAVSRTTSVAVSNPIPKTMPTKNICQVWLMDRMNRPKNRYMSPRAWSWRSSSCSLYRPRRMSRKTRAIPTSTTRFSAAIRYRKLAAIRVPAIPPSVSYAELGLTTAPNTARAASEMPVPTATMIVE